MLPQVKRMQVEHKDEITVNAETRVSPASSNGIDKNAKTAVKKTALDGT
jgi:hypothetical protein